MSTIDTLARETGVSHSTAYRRLRALGIYPVRRLAITRMELEKLYLREGKSLQEVARLFKCDPCVIRNRLHHFGIKIRTHAEAMTLVGKQKRTAKFGAAHPNWRGGKTFLPKTEDYYKTHRWIKEHYGKANRCELNPNHQATVYDWANISGQYNKDRGDWLMLCHGCHYWFDHPDIPPERQAKLSPDHSYAYLQGRAMRVSQ